MAVIGKNYIFIHIHKTGGKSIRALLGNPEDWGGLHVEACQVKKFMEESGQSRKWKRAFKIAVVRNPYTWLESLYDYIRFSDAHPDHLHASNGYYHFLEWLTQEAMQRTQAPDTNKYLTQTGFIYEHGVCLVPHWYRFENFPYTMESIATYVGLENKYWHLNKNPNREARKLTDKHINLIDAYFNEDFTNFGYINNARI